MPMLEIEHLLLDRSAGSPIVGDETGIHEKGNCSQEQRAAKDATRMTRGAGQGAREQPDAESDEEGGERGADTKRREAVAKDRVAS